MATQKPISTISYNSEAFLKEKLDSWVKAHIIQAYQYICHVGEDGDKNHIHLRIEPNKKLDPMDLSDALKEYVQNSEKPLGVRPFRPSKEEDWYLYAVHDSEYLKLKYGGGEKGEKIPYDWQDIIASEDYDVETAFIRARSALKHSTVNLASRIKSGEKPLDMVLSGENVYTINALFRLLGVTDYQRLISEYQDLKTYVAQLEIAISNVGLSIKRDDDNNIYLESDIDQFESDVDAFQNDFISADDIEF